jgi:hypothetical protein
MPGFEAARRPLQEIRGRVEVRVQPVPPDAKGVVEFPVDVWVKKENSMRSESVTAHLRWTGPDPAPSTEGVLGLPSRIGAFRIYSLPDGPWELEVAGSIRGEVVRGRKAFERRGDTVDLGTIELRPSGRVVLRVVDSAGDPVPQAWAVVVRPDEDPEKARRLDLDGNGSVAVRDLEPGVGHRAVVKGLPRDLEQTVVAAADPKPVVFAWPGKLVPCRIRLLVDGRAVANPDERTTIPAVVQESPLPREKGTWRPDGTFEAGLVPGTYRFSVLATPKEGGALAPFSAEFTVPEGDLFEVRLELQREGR